jgi:hypothetical protein
MICLFIVLIICIFYNIIDLGCKQEAMESCSVAVYKV